MHLRQDPVGSAPSASTSHWRGRSSDGTVSRVRQVLKVGEKITYSIEY